MRLISDYTTANLWSLTDQQQLFPSSSNNTLAYAANTYSSYVMPITETDHSSLLAASIAPLTCAYTNDVLSCVNGDKNNLFLTRESDSQPMFSSTKDVSTQVLVTTFKRVC
jgi:hypothetical protein